MNQIFKNTKGLLFVFLFFLLLHQSVHPSLSRDWEVYDEKLADELSDEGLDQEELFDLEKEMFRLEELDDKLLACLCRAACDDAGWRCGVVSCIYSPEYSNESPSCANDPGVCKCVGFGCGRASISFASERSQRCFERHGDPFEGEEFRSDELQELDEKIAQYRNQLLVLVRAQELGKASGKEVSEQLEKLTSLIGNRVEIRMDEREDMSEEQRKRVVEITKQHLGSYKEVEVGEGSSVVTSCRFLRFWCSDQLHIDPSSSVDIIYHELSHIIYEELSPDFQELTGSSYHEFAGFSSSEHVAFDEAIANFIALDLMDSTVYGSAGVDDEIVFDTGDEHYMYDFVTNKLYLSDPSDLKNLIEIDEGNRAQHLKYYGNDALEDMARSKIADAEKRLREIAAETVYLKGRLDSGFEVSPNLGNYIVNEVFVDMDKLNEELDSRKHLFEELENAPERLKVLAQEAEDLKKEKDRNERRLHRPAYSPKGELSVTRLLFEVTGGSQERDRLGKVLEATENFTKAKGRGPTSELELLQGFLYGKDKESEDFKNVVEILKSDDFRRKYEAEDLILE